MLRQYSIISCLQFDTTSAGFDSMILGSVDSFGHLIVSKLDSNGKGMVFLIIVVVLPVFLLLFYCI